MALGAATFEMAGVAGAAGAGAGVGDGEAGRSLRWQNAGEGTGATEIPKL